LKAALLPSPPACPWPSSPFPPRVMDDVWGRSDPGTIRQLQATRLSHWVIPHPTPSGEGWSLPRARSNSDGIFPSHPTFSTRKFLKQSRCLAGPLVPGWGP
jgi:hypothetical protein